MLGMKSSLPFLVLMAVVLVTGCYGPRPLAGPADRMEDRVDRAEDRVDEAVDLGPRDRREDRWDRRENVRDRMSPWY